VIIWVRRSVPGVRIDSGGQLRVQLRVPPNGVKQSGQAKRNRRIERNKSSLASRNQLRYWGIHLAGVAARAEGNLRVLSHIWAPFICRRPRLGISVSIVCRSRVGPGGGRIKREKLIRICVSRSAPRRWRFSVGSSLAGVAAASPVWCSKCLNLILKMLAPFTSSGN
jgi:hypothetical protein